MDHSSAELARTLAATGEQSATTTSSGPPSSPSSPEQIGRFLILGELGRGGMGVVYAAYDPQLDRKVAIKLILGERAGPGGQERLRREAQAMARLSHQHVVHIHDVGNAEGGVYLAMEYVHGRTLRAWLEESPREVQAILEVFLQAAAGLSAAHAAGVIHRDFKPDNILIDERGQVKIADFGLARELGGGSGHADPRAAVGLTVDGSVLGTPAYMAPEQHLGASSDARSDQYSFCVALWEALYGARPFVGATIGDLRAAVLEGRLAEPANPGRARWIWPLLARGLRHSPDERWPSMEALTSALGRDPSRRRRRWLLAGAGLAGLVAATAGGLRWREAEQGRRLAECSASEAISAELWGAETRAAVRAAVLATELPDAERSAAHVEQTIDEYLSRWTAVLRESCEAVHLRGELTPEVMALREGCLASQQQALQVTIELFADADATVVEHLMEVTSQLPRPERCTDLRQIVKFAEARPDPAQAMRARRIGVELRRAEVEETAGRYQRGLDKALPLLAEAETLGDRRLIARAHMVAGRLAADIGENADASEHFLAGFTDALRVDAPHLAADLANNAMFHAVNRRGDLEEGLKWSRIAEALIERVQDDELRLLHLNYRGALLTQRGDYAGALAVYDEALALADRLGATAFEQASLQSNRGIVLNYLGRREEAIAANRLALARYMAALGEEHPEVAQMRSSLGVSLLYAGELPEAREQFARAADVQERLLGPDHPLLAQSLLNLAAAEIELGDFASARVHAVRGGEIVAASGEAAAMLRGYAEYALGDALLRQGELDTAEPHCARSLDLLTELLGGSHPHVATPLVCLGEVRLLRGDPAGARGLLARATAAIGAGLDVPEADRGRIGLAQARALDALGERTAALAAADEAVARYRAAGRHYEDRRAAVQSWRDALARRE